MRHRTKERMLWLEVFEWKTGEQLVAYDFVDTFGTMPWQRYVTRIPGSRFVTMSIGGSVMVFDPLTAEVKSKTHIGNIPFTEVVVSDKPLILRGD